MLQIVAGEVDDEQILIGPELYLVDSVDVGKPALLESNFIALFVAQGGDVIVEHFLEEGLVEEEHADVVVEDGQRSLHDALYLELLLLYAAQNVLQLGEGTFLVDQLLPVAQVQIYHAQRRFFLLQQKLVEFAVDLHIAGVVVLLVEFEEQSLDKHFVGEVKFVRHDDGDGGGRLDLRLHLVVQDVGLQDEELVGFLVLLYYAVD